MHSNKNNSVTFLVKGKNQAVIERLSFCRLHELSQTHQDMVDVIEREWTRQGYAERYNRSFYKTKYSALSAVKTTATKLKNAGVNLKQIDTISSYNKQVDASRCNELLKAMRSEKTVEQAYNATPFF